MRKVNLFLPFYCKYSTHFALFPYTWSVCRLLVETIYEKHSTNTHSSIQYRPLFGTKCQSFIRDNELREGQEKTIKLPHVDVRPDRRSFHPWHCWLIWHQLRWTKHELSTFVYSTMYLVWCDWKTANPGPPLKYMEKAIQGILEYWE